MKKNRSQSSALGEVIKKFKNVFIVLGLFSFFINLLMLVPSIFMLQVYDRVLTSRNIYTLLMLIFIVLLLYAMMSALEWIRSRILNRLGSQIDESLNKEVFTASFLSRLYKAGGDTRQALNDLSQLRQFSTSNGLISFFDAPWAPIYLAFIFLLHPMLGWFSLAGMVLIVILALINERATREPLTDANRIGQQSNASASNQLANAEVIQAMGMLPNLLARWQQRHHKMLYQQSVASDRAAIVSAVTKFVRIAMQSLILGLGAYFVVTEGMSAGIMIVASILMGRALAPIEQLIGSWRGFVASRESYTRLDKLLAAFKQSEQLVTLPKPVGSLHAEHVVAMPPQSQEPILKGVDFRLPAGETLVILGPSGSGKSTLARLMVGVWPASKGSVRLDGSDVFKWDNVSLGPWIGYLPQDVELFEGSIAENIARFGELDSVKIIHAAQRAGVHELILSFPKGYETQIGPGGSVLSGGQRQRIGLARALYNEPALIVLDEPNSNLDEQGDLALINAVKLLRSNNVTTVIITHRPNLVALADKLLILNQGRVQAYGPRNEIVQSIRATTNKPEQKLKNADTL